MKKFVAFFEIPAADFDRAIEFYQTIFNLQFETSTYGEEKMAFFNDSEGNSCGAISFSKGFNPSQDGILISLTCGDITKTLKLVESSGGKILMPKNAIGVEGAGYFALFIDSEGNKLGLWSEK